MSEPDRIRIEVGLLLLKKWCEKTLKELRDPLSKDEKGQTVVELSDELGASSSERNKDVITRNALYVYASDNSVKIESVEGERAGRIDVVDPLRMMARIETYLADRRYREEKRQEKEERNPPGQLPAEKNPPGGPA